MENKPFGNLTSQSSGNHNVSLYGYPPGGNYWSETDPQSPIFDQSIEAALSRLNLSSASHRQSPFLPADLRRDFGGIEDSYAIGGEGSIHPKANLQGMSVQNLLNALNGEMGFGGAHRNPTVRMQNWEAFQTGLSPTASNEPWQTDDAVSCGGGSHHKHDDGFFLQRKKQLGKQLNSQFPIVPCSSRSGFFIDSDPHLDGYASDNSNVSRHNSYPPALHQFPQHLNHLSLKDLRGRIVCLAKDQSGCRLLQTKFENPKEKEIEMILSEVIDHLGELMRHQFGNYFIQKLVKVCTEKQRTRIILTMTKTPFQLIFTCLNPHGTRSVQILLEHITSQLQIFIIMSALSPGAVALATDPNGYHVIQYCLKRFSDDNNKYLLKEIADNCFEIATNKSGCCLLQSCLELSRGEYRECLVAKIIANALRLAEDPYGNYVVQRLLELRIPEVTENLLRQLEGSYESLSCNKYASNVIEKCLIESGEEQSSQIIMELLRSSNVSMLLVHPFGNFVIQSALSVSKGYICSALLNLVRVNAPSICNNLYGKKVLVLFNKMKLQRNLYGH